MKSTCKPAVIAFGTFLPLLACAAGPLAAGESTPIDTIVTTGTRLPDDLAVLPGSTAVIDRAAIEAANAATVLDLLRSTPGLQVTQPGGRGGIASVFIRGGEANFTMVLLDGIRVNDPNNTRGGSFDFSTLDVGDIERIEIVRGPQSAIYGSDALSGVINVITRRRAEEPEIVLEGAVGEEGYEHAGVGFAGPLGAAGGFSLRAATLDDGDITPGNAFTSDSVTGKLSFGAGDTWHVNLFSRYSDNRGTSFPEDSGGPRLAVLRSLDRKSSRDFTAGLAAGLALSDRWSLDFRAARYAHTDSYTSPGVAPGLRDPVPANGASSDLDRLSLSAYLTGEFGAALRATVGADVHDVDGSSEGFIEFAPGVQVPTAFALERRVAGAFAELRYRPADTLTLLAGLRRDDPDARGAETTVKLGGRWQPAGGSTIVRASWGEGFKLPSFFALGNPLVGNPQLRSEKSESAELGVTRRLSDALSTTLSVYRSEFTDLVDFDFDLFMNVNRRSVTAKGAELQATWSATPDLDLAAEVAWLDLEVPESDVPLRQRPDWRGSLVLRWVPATDWLVHAAWSFVGETFDSSVPTGGLWLDGYERLDATLTWRPTEHLDLLLSVDNLLDTDYEEAIGFLAPARRGRLGFRYRY